MTNFVITNANVKDVMVFIIAANHVKNKIGFTHIEKNVFQNI